jgi:predicted RNase H-like HicB family nuclease
MGNDMERKELAFYLDLRYPVTIHMDPDGGYVAEIEELSGCMTQAETLDEAFGAIEDARQVWIKGTYEMGQDIPLPHSSRRIGQVRVYQSNLATGLDFHYDPKVYWNLEDRAKFGSGQYRVISNEFANRLGLKWDKTYDLILKER